MSLPEPLKFSISGFSARRVALMLGGISFGFVPVHYFVSCEGSAATGAAGFTLFAVSSLLCLATPCDTPRRFRPLGLAFVALVLHMLSAH